MGKKRKSEKTEEQIRHKIKKLQEQLNATTSRRIDSPSPPVENINCMPLNELDPDHAASPDLEFVDFEEDQLFQPTPLPASPRFCTPRPDSPLPPPPSPLIAPPAPPPSPKPGTSAEAKPPEASEEQELDEEILQLLGDAPKTETPMGPSIHKDVANRWQDILANGLPKETKEKLVKSYLVPSNCDFLLAPALNPEVKAALQDTLVKRDSSLMYKQNQLGIALSALATVTDMVISNETSKQKILKPLSDACRILCDSHFSETKTRRNFVISSINTNLKGALLETKRGNLLFGDNVTDKLKAAKTIQQSGDALKNAQRSKVNRPKAVPKGPNKGNLNFTPQHRKTDNKTPSSTKRVPRATQRAPRSSNARQQSPPTTRASHRR